MSNDEIEQRLQKIEADIEKMRQHPYWKFQLIVPEKEFPAGAGSYTQLCNTYTNTGETND